MAEKSLARFKAASDGSMGRRLSALSLEDFIQELNSELFTCRANVKYPGGPSLIETEIQQLVLFLMFIFEGKPLNPKQKAFMEWPNVQNILRSQCVDDTLARLGLTCNIYFTELCRRKDEILRFVAEHLPAAGGARRKRSRRVRSRSKPRSRSNRRRSKSNRRA